MTRCLALFALGVLAIVPNALEAQAQTFTWRNPSFRPISGEPGVNADVHTAASNRGISAIAWNEKGNRPVEMRITHERLCSAHCQENYDEYGDIVLEEGNWGSNSSISVSVGEDHYIVALRVCTSGQNQRNRRRLKGLRLWGARLSHNGTVIRNDDRKSDQNNNCNDWSQYPKRSCIGNRVAVGIQVYWNQDDAFSGIELQCAEIVSATANSEMNLSLDAGDDR